MSLLDKASLVVTPNAVKAGKLYSIVPSSGAGDMDVVRETTATRVNSLGLIENVGLNVARLNYDTIGGCPSLLVEPQRTNFINYSERFENINWIKARATVTENSIFSPDGLLTADIFLDNTDTDSHLLYQPITYLNNTTYTASVFMKRGTINYGYLVFANGQGFSSNIGIVVNLNNGSFTSNGVTAPSSSKVEDYGNGWYRVSITDTTNSTSGRSAYIGTSSTGNALQIYLGTGSGSIYIWGYQLEAGSSATSYIPTLASIQTRNADRISKTGISDLIGQTEGTIFVELNLKNLLGNQNRRIIALSNNNIASENIQITFTSALTNTIRAVIGSGGNFSIITSSQIINLGKIKIAFSYSLTNAVMFINGIKEGVDLNVATKPIMNFISLGSLNNTDILNDNINSTVIFKTALTNQECINLTTL